MKLSPNTRYIDITTTTEHAMPMRCSSRKGNEDQRAKKLQRKEIFSVTKMSFRTRVLVRAEGMPEIQQPRCMFVDSEKYYGICVKPNSRINSIFEGCHAKKIFISFILVMHTFAQCRTLPLRKKDDVDCDTHAGRSKQRKGKTPNRTMEQDGIASI